jgi:thymidylate synthase ThyX
MNNLVRCFGDSNCHIRCNEDQCQHICGSSYCKIPLFMPTQLPYYSKDSFSSEEASILKVHFSNIDKQIFAIITPRQVDRGALMSRYSRSDKTMRRIFLDEFINNPARGEEFYQRVLQEYGDDSVAELGESQLGIEWISNIAAKKIEDQRIGLSYLEKSSRYVAFDKKVCNVYKYYRDNNIINSKYGDQFINACDNAFETYSKSISLIEKFIAEIQTINDFRYYDSKSKFEKRFDRLTDSEDIDAAKKIYKNTIKARTLDILRTLLPAATLTNLGITGNGRSFEYLLIKLYTSPLQEIRNLAIELNKELDSIIPSFIKRANDKYGKLMQTYFTDTNIAVSKLANKYLKGVNYTKNNLVRLVDYTDNLDAEIAVASAILYEQAKGVSLHDVKTIVKNLPQKNRHEILKIYTKFRKNRRHRPGRAFEMTEYVFDMFTNFGMFRDLHRHRILTIERQLLTTKHGYDIPSEIISSGLEKDYRDCMSLCNDAYTNIAKTMPYEAQYVVNFAYRYPYFLKMNLREACHMIELRTTAQGHPDYRYVCQKMYQDIKKVHPILAKGVQFVDVNEYSLGRFDSEKKADKKKRMLV